MCVTRTLFSYLIGSQLLPVLKDDESVLCHSSFIDDSSLLALLLMKAFYIYDISNDCCDVFSL